MEAKRRWGPGEAGDNCSPGHVSGEESVVLLLCFLRHYRPTNPELEITPALLPVYISYFLCIHNSRDLKTGATDLRQLAKTMIWG